MMRPVKVPWSDIDARVDVLVALALAASPPSAPCPSAEDIAAWYEQRRAGASGDPGVTAHMGHCAECFAVWTGLVDAEQVLDPRAELVAQSPGLLPRSFAWLTRPRSLLAGSAVAMAAALLLVLLPDRQAAPPWRDLLNHSVGVLAASDLPQRAREVWPWKDGLGTRSLTSPGPDIAEPWELAVARTAFRNGARAALSGIAGDRGFWREVQATLPSGTVRCSDAPEPVSCSRVNDVLHSAGRWAIVLHLACEVGPVGAPALGDDFWASQHAILDGLQRDVHEILPGSLYDIYYTDWGQALAAGAARRTALCDREAGHLGIGLALD